MIKEAGGRLDPHVHSVTLNCWLRLSTQFGKGARYAARHVFNTLCYNRVVLH